MKPNQAWQATLGELQLQMTRATFDTWVKQTSVLSYDDGLFAVAVRSNFAKEWLENRLMGQVKRTLGNIMGRSVEIRFVIQPKEHQLQETDAGPLLSESMKPVETTLRTPPDNGSSLPLNSRYTFETFVVGASNRLAHAATQSVAERPAAAYNPLFLYGGVGLGKTHLLQAIGHYSLERGRSVRYVSSEQFTNDLINAIRGQTTERFREKYRSIDVLLIDDIQFIAGKESTQEEFFHTFNTLHAANKQIVMTCDRSPKAIAPLEERLRSRFEGGLMADVSPPDLETRIAILQSKAESQRNSVPPAVLEFIAHKVQSNIRELEGSLNRVIMYGLMMNAPLSVDLASEALHDIMSRSEDLEPNQILTVISEHYRVPIEEILGTRRSRPIAQARQMTMYMLRTELEISFPQVGNLIGGRDHSTVMYACDKIRRLVEEDPGLRRDYLTIRDTLYEQAEEVRTR